MATSLLFQHLQQIGLPVLQQLQIFLCTRQPTDDAALCDGSNAECCCCCKTCASSSRPTLEPCKCRGSGISCSSACSSSTNGISYSNVASVDNDASGLLNSSSSSNCSSHAVCLAHRIISLSIPLVPPPPPYSVDTNGVLQCSCSSSTNSIGSSCSSSSTGDAASEGSPSHRSILSIDSMALASAAFVPCLFPLFRGLWEASNEGVWPLPLEEPAPPCLVVTVETWKLHPSAELSSQLKLWGNAALARDRPAAAASLYTAATMLLPSITNGSTPNSSKSLLAVLCANASSALLRLRRIRRALRTATEAVAANPMYRKAWHRRAAALVHVRGAVERYFVALCSKKNSSSSSSSRDSASANTDDCTAAARACLQQVDREIAEAQMMSQGQANVSEAIAAASRMMVGCCGCGSSATLRPSSDNKDTVSDRPWLWLRKDVSAHRDAKGWGLVTADDGLSRLENDPCLVLEEEAFAVFVHPDLCAPIPKIPFALPPHNSAFAQNPEGLELHADATIRDQWEARVEEGAVGKKECERVDESGKGRHEAWLELQEETEGICAGCATVPARGEVAANECHMQGPDTWHSTVSHLLYPTLPVVPCGSCAAAMFCCQGCRAASSHKRACRLHQMQQAQQQEACGMESRSTRGDDRKGPRGEASESMPGTQVQPLALALPDPHRFLARQLLASLLPPAIPLEEPAVQNGSTALVNAKVQARVLGEPPWRQLLMRTSSVVVDSTMVADWLLNAAWLAGEATAYGRGLHCGGRCLICRPAGREPPATSQSASATAESAAARFAHPSDETPATHPCGWCCVCCRRWCPKCSVCPSRMQEPDGLSRNVGPFPRCLFAAALHAYGVACCNSFTIRVLCDPEEEAVAAGTAVFLAASLLNHSCTPNAIVAFGEPKVQLQRKQERDQNRVHQHQGEDNVDSAAAPDAPLLVRTRGVGRGALLQVRLGAPNNSGCSGRVQEVCISYGPVIGLPKSSWGFRQDWLIKHAGFFCRCEACLPPPADNSPADCGGVAFRYELLCGFPCPHCTSISGAQKILSSMRENTSNEQEQHALFDAAALLNRCFGPHLHKNPLPAVRLRKVLAEKTASYSLFLKMPEKTLEFVTAFSKLLHRVLTKGQVRQPWTSKNIPIYAFSELYCLNCSSRFPASGLERNREAIHVQLDRVQSALRNLVSPFSKATKAQQGALLAEVLKDILQAIPQVVAVSGCLSTGVWEALQSAARAAHAKAEVMRQVHADSIWAVESVGMAATCLSAGIYVLLQRLPLGLSQPEVSAHMYKVALLLGQIGGRAQTKQVLEAVAKATLNSYGPHSVSQSYVKAYLRWMEREDE